MTGHTPLAGPRVPPGGRHMSLAGGNTAPDTGLRAPYWLMGVFYAHISFQGSPTFDYEGTATDGATRGGPRTVEAKSLPPGPALPAVATSALRWWTKSSERARLPLAGSFGRGSSRLQPVVLTLVAGPCLEICSSGPDDRTASIPPHKGILWRTVPPPLDPSSK